MTFKSFFFLNIINWSIYNNKRVNSLNSQSFLNFIFVNTKVSTEPVTYVCLKVNNLPTPMILKFINGGK